MFVFIVGAAAIGSALYWQLRPTKYENPELTAYKMPAPAPIFPLIAHGTKDQEIANAATAAVETAKHENELLGAAIAENSEQHSNQLAQAQVPATNQNGARQVKRSVRQASRAKVRPRSERPREWAFQQNRYENLFRW
jgi:hypothetical protein